MEWVHFAKKRTFAKKVAYRREVEYDNRYELVLARGGKVICLSGDESANIVSKHCHVLMCDEKQDMSCNVVTDSLIPMLGDHDGIVVYSGVGGDPHSAGEKLGRKAAYRREYTWQEHVKVKPQYINIVEYEQRHQMPEQFASNFEAKPLDIGSKLLIPKINPYSGDINVRKARAIVGIDWGKRVDSSVATLVHNLDETFFVSKWLIPKGSYDRQVDKLTDWLEHSVDFDVIYSETNGVGDSATDSLIRKMGERAAIVPMQIDQSWKNDKARELHRLASDGHLMYNEEEKESAMFIDDITSVEYSMTSMENIQLGHSDFLSSLMLTLEDSNREREVNI